MAHSLQVTERTVYAWFSGKTAVPYAAYRLLRILNRFELPGWDGWHMHSGKLWSPEGFGFEPQDGTWWSLLVRQARAFRALQQRAVTLGVAEKAQGAESPPVPGMPQADGAGGLAEPGPSALADGRREAPPNLFQSHIPTEHSVRYVFKGYGHA